ncbi:hypothetical protein SEA_CAMERICO_46 [Gordonia phage Camerico]|nr:hypothetical protein SEA_CAMERICO_46 [Gordonia phage Camerico]
MAKPRFRNAPPGVDMCGEYGLAYISQSPSSGTYWAYGFGCYWSVNQYTRTPVTADGKIIPYEKAYDHRKKMEKWMRERSVG